MRRQLVANLTAGIRRFGLMTPESQENLSRAARSLKGALGGIERVRQFPKATRPYLQGVLGYSALHRHCLPALAKKLDGIQQALREFLDGDWIQEVAPELDRGDVMRWLRAAEGVTQQGEVLLYRIEDIVLSRDDLRRASRINGGQDQVVLRGCVIGLDTKRLRLVQEDQLTWDPLILYHRSPADWLIRHPHPEALLYHPYVGPRGQICLPREQAAQAWQVLCGGDFAGFFRAIEHGLNYFPGNLLEARQMVWMRSRRNLASYTCPCCSDGPFSSDDFRRCAVCRRLMCCHKCVSAFCPIGQCSEVFCRDCHDRWRDEVSKSYPVCPKHCRDLDRWWKEVLSHEEFELAQAEFA